MHHWRNTSCDIVKVYQSNVTANACHNKSYRRHIRHIRDITMCNLFFVQYWNRLYYMNVRQNYQHIKLTRHKNEKDISFEIKINISSKIHHHFKLRSETRQRYRNTSKLLGLYKVHDCYILHLKTKYITTDTPFSADI